MLRNLTAETRLAFSDDDFLDFVKKARTVLVPIDAPLSLPKGRWTILARLDEHLRECDRALLLRGIRFFPSHARPHAHVDRAGPCIEGHTHVDGLSIRRLLPNRCTRFTTGGMISDRRIKQRSDLLGKS